MKPPFSILLSHQQRMYQKKYRFAYIPPRDAHNRGAAKYPTLRKSIVR